MFNFMMVSNWVRCFKGVGGGSIGGTTREVLAEVYSSAIGCNWVPKITLFELFDGLLPVVRYEFVNYFCAYLFHGGGK